MAMTFDPIFATDPNNAQNVAANAAITLFDPADAGKAPITITDVTGAALPNPITVNKNGFGPAFVATIDRVGWSGGGFTGYFTSYEGLKNQAIAAVDAAENAASSAGAEAAAAAADSLSAAVASADTAASSATIAATNASNAAAAAADSATAATNAAALVGAPADAAIAAAINGAGTDTKAALNAGYATAAALAAKLDTATAATTYAGKTELANRGAAITLASQSTVYTGPESATGWAFKMVDGAAAVGAWAVTAGVLSGLPTGAKAEVGLRPESIRHGRIGALIKTRDDAVGSIWTGLVVRETATQRLVVFIRNGVGGTGRQVQVWPMTGGSFGSQLYGSTLALNGAADTQATETWTDLEVEIAGDTLRLWVNGQRIGGDITIPAGLDTSGQVGVFSNNAREGYAAEFKAMRVHSFDVRRISPAFVKGFASGSSQTAGYGLANWATEAWPNIIEPLLLSRLNAVIDVHPGGVSGENTVDMIARVTAGLTNHNPQVVFIEVSPNDFQISTAKSQTPAQTLANIKTMVNDVIAFGATPVILTSAPMNAAALTGGFTGASWAIQMESNGLVRQYAAEAGILLVDLYRAFEGKYDSTYLQADNLHWNAAGHAKVRDAVTDVLLAAKRV